MTENILTVERSGPVESAGVLPLHELADTLLGDAIWDAQQKTSPTTRGSDLGQLLAKSAFFDAFKHRLACHVAQALAENDKQVQAVYDYEPTDNADADTGEDLPLSAVVHLLVRVAKPSAALNAFVDALDQALSTAMRKLPSDVFESLESVLDVNVVTENEIEQRTGYGAILTSIFAPPIKVWQRDS